MAKETTNQGGVIRVKDLAEEFDVSPRRIRSIIRSSGRKAKAYSKKNEYGWKSDSKDLVKVRQLISDALDGYTEFVEPEEEETE